MTTEQLFLIFIIVEMIQMFLLVISSWRTQKDINRLVSDPEFGGNILSNGVHGFIRELSKDKEKQEAFFGLIQIMGQAALEGVRGSTAVKPVKLKGWAKIFEPLVNSPDVQGMIAEKLAGTIKNVGEKGAEKAAEQSGWV